MALNKILEKVLKISQVENLEQKQKIKNLEISENKAKHEIRSLREKCEDANKQIGELKIENKDLKVERDRMKMKLERKCRKDIKKIFLCDNSKGKMLF